MLGFPGQPTCGVRAQNLKGICGQAPSCFQGHLPERRAVLFGVRKPALGNRLNTFPLCDDVLS